MYNNANMEWVLQLNCICSEVERSIPSYKISFLVAVIKMWPEKKLLEWKKPVRRALKLM